MLAAQHYDTDNIEWVEKMPCQWLLQNYSIKFGTRKVCVLWLENQNEEMKRCDQSNNIVSSQLCGHQWTLWINACKTYKIWCKRIPSLLSLMSWIVKIIRYFSCTIADCAIICGNYGINKDIHFLFYFRLPRSKIIGVTQKNQREIPNWKRSLIVNWYKNIL